MKKVSSRRTWIFRFALLAFSSLVSLAILEAGCRLIGFTPIEKPTAGEPPELHEIPFIREAQLAGWIHRPRTSDVIETEEAMGGLIPIVRNGSSFREDDQTPIEKPPGTYRIMVTGDSHTDGVVANQQSYANQLEQQLGLVDGASRFDVINAGFSVFSPYQEWWAYNKVLQHYELDMLIVGFYAGNDMWELMLTDRVHLDVEGEQFVHREKAPEVNQSPPNESPSIFRSFKNFLRERFALYTALTTLRPIRRILGTVDERDAFQQRIDQVAKVSPPSYWQSLGQAYYFKTNPLAWDEAVAKLQYTLTQFKQRTDERNTRLIVLNIPTLRQIHPETDRDNLKAAEDVLELSSDNLSTDDRAREALVELAGDLGIEVIDLTNVFFQAREKDPERSLYWRFDHHINAAGHKLIADHLAEILWPQIRESKQANRDHAN